MHWYCGDGFMSFNENNFIFWNWEVRSEGNETLELPKVKQLQSSKAMAADPQCYFPFFLPPFLAPFFPSS